MSPAGISLDSSLSKPIERTNLLGVNGVSQLAQSSVFNRLEQGPLAAWLDTYIEDCEVCCRPIEVTYAVNDDEVRQFEARA